MKTHVCVDARLICQSGIGTYLRSVIASLVDMGCNLTLLGFKQDSACLKGYNSTVRFLQSPIYSFKEQLELAQSIPRCDIFFAPHFNIPLLPIRAKKRMTCICDVYHLAHLHQLSFLQKCYAKVMYNAACLFSDLVITISEFSKREILKWITFKPKKLRIVSPVLSIPPQTKHGAREGFILSVGSLKPHKNWRRLIEAYLQLKPKEPLVIVGKKEGLITMDRALFTKIESDPFLRSHVRFTGYISDEKLQELYNQASLFIFPSTYEGFGYPPLEAMAYDCPVVASNSASIPEVLGDAAEYVDPLSITSIAAGINRVLQDTQRKEELIEKGKRRALYWKNKTMDLKGAIDACCNCA